MILRYNDVAMNDKSMIHSDDRNNLSRGRRLVMFLYSTPNLVGAALGLVGLGLYFVGVIGPFWLPIVVGLYVIGVMITPRSRAYEVRWQTTFQKVDIRNELENMVNRVRRRLPKESYEKVVRIKDTILEILPHVNDLSTSDYNVFLIQQTAFDYLPSALENYLSLPRAYADHQPVKDGKTARVLLYEQLDLLDREMREVVKDMYANDTQKLLAHGQFLKDKFGEGGVRAVPPPPPPKSLP